MCEVSVNDMEIAKVWLETVRRAAKAHRCSSCGSTIERGELHLHHVSILDSVDRERMCFLCWWAREDFQQEHADAPRLMPSALGEFLAECARWDDEGAARWGGYLEQLRERSTAARTPAALDARMEATRA